jgi:hypothetical protein
MSANPVRMLSGVNSVQAAEQLHLAVRDRKDDWPYVHVYPPASAQDVCVIGAQPTQLQGTAAIEVVRYQVTSGKRFYLQAVLLGANVFIIPGQCLFTVIRNATIGAISSQFMPEHGLANVGFQLGSQARPWKLQRSREFQALDTVSIQATNVALGEGDPNWYICGLFGYEVPVMDVKALK